MRVKVVMGFVLLAVMFKYLSNIDQVLRAGLLTRERFLAVWFVMFALGAVPAGLFAVAWRIDPGESMGIGRLLAGILVFAFSLLSGDVRWTAGGYRRLRSGAGCGWRL